MQTSSPDNVPNHHLQVHSTSRSQAHPGQEDRPAVALEADALEECNRRGVLGERAQVTSW
jgi:hypothetical protein